jgi:hypothetical protein
VLQLLGMASCQIKIAACAFDGLLISPIADLKYELV